MGGLSENEVSGEPVQPVTGRPLAKRGRGTDTLRVYAGHSKGVW